MTVGELRTWKLKKIVNRHSVVEEAVKEIIAEGLALTNSEARRYFYLIKGVNK